MVENTMQNWVMVQYNQFKLQFFWRSLPSTINEFPKICIFVAWLLNSLDLIFQSSTKESVISIAWTLRKRSILMKKITGRKMTKINDFCMLFVGDGIIHQPWCTYRTGKEYRRKQEKLREVNSMNAYIKNYGISHYILNRWCVGTF